MKPFDLDAALRGEPVVTRGGSSDVKIAGYNPDAATSGGVVVGWVGGYVCSWNKDGQYYGRYEPYSSDLFMKYRTVEKWAVMVGLFPVGIYSTKEEAEKYAGGKPIAHVTWEE